MSFRQIDLQESYRSDECNIVDAFYLPVLSESIKYYRAVGYFNSASMALAAKGISALIENGGKMRLVASPQLDDKDIKAIKKGYEQPEEVIKRSILNDFKNVEEAVVKKRLDFLAWLVAEGLLDIRFAIVDRDQDEAGIYHEKIGIFKDSDGNALAFTGSGNETRGGIYSNFESIEVFKSWDSDKSRVQNKLKNFESLWTNETNNLEIVDFSEASKREIFNRFKSPNRPIGDPESSLADNKSGMTSEGESENYEVYSDAKGIKIPEEIDLRKYQKKAIVNWLKNRGKGILKMATGSGKTITALGAATKMREHLLDTQNKQPLTIIVVCPYKHLVTQWDNNAKDFGYEPIKCFEAKTNWNNILDSSINSVNLGLKDNLFVITTNSTYSGKEFQRIFKKLNRPILLIVDEVHNFGSKKIRKLYPQKCNYRLGLSATPERWMDEEGTEKLFNYFNSVVFEFTLEDAISNNYLSDYYYFPVLVELTTDEAQQYLKLSKDIAKLSTQYDIDDPDTPLSRLLIKRARITANAENKLQALEDVVKENEIDKKKYNLVYCGDGRVDSGTTEEEIRQIEAVTKVLGKKLGMSVSRYVSETKTEKRKELLDSLETGEIQSLVAIRCLDEGVDIPITKRALILASSSNPRQFIQRRGRVLRKAKGKKHAKIWDFLTIPPLDSITDESFNYERKLVKKELSRVLEFSRLALNGPQAENRLSDLKEKFNLLNM